MKIRAWLTNARFRLAWLIMPAKVKEAALAPQNKLELRAVVPPKAPSPLWINRRQAMIAAGYDPRDTAEP